jgi:3-methyladenine DNA glycosylase AlkD
MDTLFAEIVTVLEKRASPRTAHAGSRFDKNPDYIAYGLYASEVRDLIRGFRSRFVRLSPDQKLSLAERLYRASIGELASVATYLIASCRDGLSPRDFGRLDRCLDHFHGWGTTDDFSVSVLGPLLRRHPAATIRLLTRWNRSRNRWKRRASVVAFARKIGASGRFTDEALRLCDRLIWDRDDLVQKGVGWALKDSMRGNRRKVYQYVQRLRTIGAPATITLYAMRDLRGRERSGLLELRAAPRPGG